MRVNSGSDGVCSGHLIMDVFMFIALPQTFQSHPSEDVDTRNK